MGSLSIDLVSSWTSCSFDFFSFSLPPLLRFGLPFGLPSTSVVLATEVLEHGRDRAQISRSRRSSASVAARTYAIMAASSSVVASDVFWASCIRLRSEERSELRAAISSGMRVAVAEAFMACLAMSDLLLAMFSAFIFSSAFRALRALGRPREVLLAPGELDLSRISCASIVFVFATIMADSLLKGPRRNSDAVDLEGGRIG